MYLIHINSSHWTPTCFGEYDRKCSKIYYMSFKFTKKGFKTSKNKSSLATWEDRFRDLRPREGTRVLIHEAKGGCKKGWNETVVILSRRYFPPPFPGVKIRAIAVYKDVLRVTTPNIQGLRWGFNFYKARAAYILLCSLIIVIKKMRVTFNVVIN